MIQLSLSPQGWDGRYVVAALAAHMGSEGETSGPHSCDFTA